jgi:four helix bundle protein
VATTSFTQLDVWKKAHQVTLAVHRVIETFPVRERFCLANQMWKAAVSVPANIAEGYGRRRPPDKARFYTIAEGSTEELKYYLILTRDLGYLKDFTAIWKPLEDVSSMLRRLVDRTLGTV